MKQTVEEAAIAFANKCHAANIKGGLDYPYDELDMRNAFEEGVKWQSKQSPWISVEERLPQPNEKVIILTMNGKHIYVATIDEHEEVLVYRPDYDEPYYYCNIEDGYVSFWMPIPTFDQILEANKDVLQRMK